MMMGAISPTTLSTGAVVVPQKPNPAPSLLPPPSQSASPNDAMASLYLLMSKQRQSDLTSNQTRVNVEHRNILANEAVQQKAMKDEVDAANNAATWGVFAKVAAVVVTIVSAVASIFTCGAASGLLVASAFLSAAAFAESETHVVGKLSGSDAASTGTTIGFGVASAICSFGATAIGSTAQVTTQAAATAAQVGATSAATSAQAVGTAAATTATAAQAAGTAGSTTASVATTVFGVSADTSKLVAGVGGVVSGAGQVAQGGVEIGSAAWTYAGARADINVTEASLHEAKMNRLTDWILSSAKEADKSHERALGSLQGAIQTKGQTLVTASSMKG